MSEIAAARKTRNARNFGSQPLMNGSSAITGASAMRDSVRIFGRVQIMARSASAEGLENQLGHCLQRLEYTFARHRDRLEIRGPLDPAAILLEHQRLARVPRIGRGL